MIHNWRTAAVNRIQMRTKWEFKHCTYVIKLFKSGSQLNICSWLLMPSGLPSRPPHSRVFGPWQGWSNKHVSRRYHTSLLSPAGHSARDYPNTPLACPHLWTLCELLPSILAVYTLVTFWTLPPWLVSSALEPLNQTLWIDYDTLPSLVGHPVFSLLWLHWNLRLLHHHPLLRSFNSFLSSLPSPPSLDARTVVHLNFKYPLPRFL